MSNPLDATIGGAANALPSTANAFGQSASKVSRQLFQRATGLGLTTRLLDAFANHGVVATILQLLGDGRECGRHGVANKEVGTGGRLLLWPGIEHPIIGRLNHGSLRLLFGE
jgi:hypothetical protein